VSADVPDPLFRRMSADGAAWLGQLEGGLKLRAYRDVVNVWTLSAGVTCYPDGRRVCEGDECSPSEALSLFCGALLRFEQCVDHAARPGIYGGQFDSLVACCYNIGEQSFRTSTLLKFVNADVPLPRIRQQFLRWTLADTDPNHEGLEHSPGLRRRRLCEWELYSRGVYLTQGQIRE